MKREEKTATRNIFMLYLMNIAKMVFPLVTLPYLTRVMSEGTYGTVTYVKAVMQYMQLLTAFGFSLSATKDVVAAAGDKGKLSGILGDVQLAKLILSAIGAVAVAVMTMAIPLLRENILYTVLSYLNVVMMAMLADFLFQGVDRMEVLTIRFVVSKVISTICTFLFIKSDADLLLIPIFDCLGSGAALVMMLVEVKKMGLNMVPTGLKNALRILKESATYFVSDMATTAFGALNTLLIGIYIEETQVAYWGVVMQLVGAVQSMYSPVINGIYPSMLRTRSIGFVKKITMIFMPIVTVGCMICYFGADLILQIVGGSKYVVASPVFRCMIPVMFIGFPAMLYGWPTLGPIGKVRQTSITTVVTAIAQVVGLVLLLVFDQFTLINIALLRGATELLMLILRVGFCVRYRKEYNP